MRGKHTKEKMFRCSACFMEFIRSDGCRVHINKRHKGVGQVERLGGEMNTAMDVEEYFSNKRKRKPKAPKNERYKTFEIPSIEIDDGERGGSKAEEIFSHAET
eukprot:CAMPEP_0114500876 /NCGR_PEP_ID=MMETSP0109-20121206/8198_1 /TAXON_ID=29199 /ORGANISM="Chlorarachnion reptans, Strain CCCM449" /LENGTH=102 /DNA_ID=CAMNT_0001678567 /DNA_START=413 /DNA_END=721 /DNA_ORIENTATION=+